MTVAATGEITMRCIPVMAGVKINELFLFGDDPYVELYNVGSVAVDMSDWQAVFVNRLGTTTTVEVDVTALGPGEFAVVGIANVELDLSGGGVRLDDASGAAVDAAGWKRPLFFDGLLPDGFYETGAMIDIPSYQAVGRFPDGYDTGDNRLDFTVGIPSTPGEPNIR